MNWKIVIGLLVGGGLGFAYYRFIGCVTGTCPLTSNPYISSGFGALIGAIAANSPKPTNKNNP